MSASAIPMEQWLVQFHELMAALLRTRAAIEREVGILGVAKGLWDVSRDVKNLRPVRDGLYESLVAAPEDVLERIKLAEYVQSTESLVRSMAELLEMARRARLTNRTLTAGSLMAIRRHYEDFAEHLDLLRLSVDPEVERSIREGREDFSAGRGVSLDSLLHG